MKKSRKNDIESIKVNPFLSLMYYKLSFSAWRKRTRRNALLRQRGQDPYKHQLNSQDNSSLKSEQTFRIESVSSEEWEEGKRNLHEEMKEEIKGNRFTEELNEQHIKRT